MKAAERRSFWEYLHEGPRDVVQLAATFAVRVTVARDGTLIVRLSWDIAQGRLSLSVLDGRLNPRTGDPPIIATQPVEAGSAYRLRVAGAAPWDYDIFQLRYVLRTVIE
jgi:hypothetical protein